MPHRHTIIYEDSDVKLAYGVELLMNSGVVLYCNSPKILSGEKQDEKEYIQRIKKWLENKNIRVELD